MIKYYLEGHRGGAIEGKWAIYVTEEYHLMTSFWLPTYRYK